MSELKTLLDCGDFDPQFLFQIYNEQVEIFDLNNFKIFIEKYIEKSKKFEEKTGIPNKYFTKKINLTLFSRGCSTGYSKVKDIFIYFDDNNTVIFLKNKKEISRISEEDQKGNWLIEQLDKLTIDYKTKDKDSDIDPTLYLSNNFKIKKSSNFFIRYYINSLYDIIVKLNNRYFFFFTIDNIDEYSFYYPGEFICEKDLLKIKRMLKIKKIELNE